MCVLAFLRHSPSSASKFDSQLTLRTKPITFFRLQNKFPAQRLRMTTAVVGALLDRASTVRRNAVALLTKLVLTHPYALLHGGPLNREEWEAGYEQVSKDLQALGAKEIEKIEAEAKDEKREEEDGMEVDGDEEEEEDDEEEEENGEEGDEEHGSPSPRRSKYGKKSKSKKPKAESRRKSAGMDLAAITQEQLDGDGVMRLKFTKRYYADALNFIRHVELAMESISEMLNSTYKQETLEAIEFFRVAHEYKFDAAEVSAIFGFSPKWITESSVHSRVLRRCST